MTDSSLSPNQREFHCPNCNGKIRIPKDLPPTTGPCPLCNVLITSPALEPEASQAYSLPPVPTRQEIPAHPVAAVPAPEPIPYDPPPQPPVPASPPPQQAEPRLIPQPAPQQPAGAERPVEKKSLTPIYVLIALLLIAAAGIFYVLKTGLPTSKPAAAKPAPAEVQHPELPHPEVNDARYLRDGWQKDSYALLEKFFSAKTAAEKLPLILDSANLKPQVEAFYARGTAIDTNTPADTFSANQLAEEDRKRGIFMMIFDQPPQFDIKDFFRPLASLEVQYGLSEADILLSTVARIENFATEPLRVAAFFKRTPTGMKLDWETFVQTKYRTLQTFAETPEPGKTGVFRVIIAQDVPDKNAAQTPGAKTYRLADPVSPEINARVKLNIDSEIGKTLTDINWIGEQGNPINRTATVELKWSADDQPELQISRFICWEFLHLGANPTIASPPPR